MTSDDSRFQVTSPARVRRLLELLSRQRAPVSMRFDDTQDSHVSMVLSVDGDARVFYLDEVGLAVGRRQAEAGAVFSAHAALDGVAVAFKGCRVTGRAVFDGVDAYAVPFPPQVMYWQRREQFRARVPRGIGVTVTLVADQGKYRLQGLLEDLSAVGCRVVFQALLPPTDLTGQHFAHVMIDAPEPFGRLELAADACHMFQDSEGRVVAGGFRFAGVSRGVTQSLERFVQHLQREAHRLQRD